MERSSDAEPYLEKSADETTTNDVGTPDETEPASQSGEDSASEGSSRHPAQDMRWGPEFKRPKPDRPSSGGFGSNIHR